MRSEVERDTRFSGCGMVTELFDLAICGRGLSTGGGGAVLTGTTGFGTPLGVPLLATPFGVVA